MISTDSIRQRVNLIDLAAALSLLGDSPLGGRQVDAACPKCGGEDRLGVMEDRFFCRQCKPLEKGKKHDCFDFVIHVGLASDFIGARQWLAEWLDGRQGSATVTVNHAATAERVDHTGGYWQTAANRAIQDGIANLDAAMPYLSGRGLTRETCEKWRLGYGDGWSSAEKATRPSILIPWPRGAAYVDGIHYRYLTPDKAGKRYGKFMFPHDASTGSTGKMTLYRLMDGKSDTLIVTEGEFNALSCWQTLGCHVVSIGSESNADAGNAELTKLAKRYATVIVWADKPDVAQRIAEALGRDATAIHSPIIDGRKLDANEMLQAGVLGEFLRSFLPSDDSLAGEGTGARGAIDAMPQPATVATIDTITSRRDAQRAYAALYAKNETNGLTDDEFSLAQAIICRWGDVKIGCAA